MSPHTFNNEKKGHTHTKMCIYRCAEKSGSFTRPEEQNQRDPGSSMARHLHKSQGGLWIHVSCEIWGLGPNLGKSARNSCMIQVPAYCCEVKHVTPPKDLEPYSTRVPSPHPRCEVSACCPAPPTRSSFPGLEETRSCSNQNEMSNVLKPEE